MVSELDGRRSGRHWDAIPACPKRINHSGKELSKNKLVRLYCLLANDVF